MTLVESIVGGDDFRFGDFGLLLLGAEVSENLSRFFRTTLLYNSVSNCSMYLEKILLEILRIFV